MKKNKVAMALVLGSVSAIIAAPSLLNGDKLGDNLADANNGDVEGDAKLAEVNKERSLIDIKAVTKLDLPEEERLALVSEVNELLKREVSTKELNEGVSLVLTGYGEDNISLEQEVYNELSLALGGQDSTSAPAFTARQYSAQPASQVRFCHAACHYACHGARGWR